MKSYIKMGIERNSVLPRIKLVADQDTDEDPRDTIFQMFVDPLRSNQSQWCKAIFDPEHRAEESLSPQALFITPIKREDLQKEFLLIAEILVQEKPDWFIRVTQDAIERNKKNTLHGNPEKEAATDKYHTLLDINETVIGPLIGKEKVYELLKRLRVPNYMSAAADGTLFINGIPVTEKDLDDKMNDLSKPGDKFAIRDQNMFQVRSYGFILNVTVSPKGNN